MSKKTGEEFAKLALNTKWDKYKYSQMDCQGFVEEVLKDLGVRKSDGSVYNWRGSNSMYRHYYTWRGTLEEAVKKFGFVPVGAFVYIWNKTGESKVGYSDGLGDAHHVGIYCGDNLVRDSSRSRKNGIYVRDGVGSRPLSDFNRVSLFVGLDYNLNKTYNSKVEEVHDLLDMLRNKLIDLEGVLNDIFGSCKDD